MMQDGDEEILQTLTEYVEGRLAPEQRDEIEFRLKVEPRLAQYLRSVEALQNLQRLRGQIPARLAMRGSARGARSYNLWVLNEEGTGFTRAARIAASGTEVISTIDTSPQRGYTAFAVSTADLLERVLYFPNRRGARNAVAIRVLHNGPLKGDAVLQIFKDDSLKEHRIAATEPVAVDIEPGRSVLKTMGTALPDATILLS